MEIQIAEHFTAAQRHAQDRIAREDLGPNAARPILEAAQMEDFRFTNELTGEVTNRLYHQLRNGSWDRNLEAQIGQLVGVGLRDPSTLAGYKLAHANGPVGTRYGVIAPGMTAPAGADTIDLQKVVVTEAHIRGQEYAARVNAREWEIKADWLERQMQSADRTGSRAEYLAAKDAYQTHQTQKPISGLLTAHELGPPPSPAEAAHVVPILHRAIANDDPMIGVTQEQMQHAKRAIAADDQELLDLMRLDHWFVDAPRRGMGQQVFERTSSFVNDTSPEAERWVVPIVQYVKWKPGDKPITADTHGPGAGSMSLREFADAAATCARLRRTWAYAWPEPASHLLKGKGVFKLSTAFGDFE